MDALKFPEWERPCEDALLEDDAKRLFQRVIVAEKAIFQRLRDLAMTPEKVELMAIDNMLTSLRCLVADALKLPDAEEKATKRLLQMPDSRIKTTAPKRKLIPIA